jgi:hypothetical protein
MPGIIRAFFLYISLSPYGKRLFLRLLKMFYNARSLPFHKDLSSTIDITFNADKNRWYSCLGSSDAGFKEFIPRWYLKEAKFKADLVYYRFLKISAILLYEHTCLFMAYNISLDAKARKRSILLSFIKRVYDDLLDNDGINHRVLFDRQPHQELMSNVEYRLLVHLRKKIREIAPEAEFPNYYSMIERVNEAQAAQKEEESIRNAIPYRIRNGFIMDMYIIKNDLPQALLDGLDLTSCFFASLDDFYDIDEDLVKGKKTFMNQAADPDQAIREKLDAAAVYLRKYSPNPDEYLKGMGNLMRNISFLRKQKLSKLSSVL